MFVSCICPTYNRFPDYGHLLCESVESFVRQDYPLDQRELIIINDCPEQQLVCNVPGVRVLNMAPRFHSLGGKRNHGCQQAKGDILLPWDDDDISLPTRINNAVAHMKDGVGYYKPSGYWFLDNGQLSHSHSIGYCHNCSAFTKKAWREVDGYPLSSGDEDKWMDHRLQRGRGLWQVRLEFAQARGESGPQHWTYLYRWGVSPRHLSGVADCNQHYVAIGNQPAIRGTYEIKPGWRVDYEEMVERYLEKLACPTSV